MTVVQFPTKEPERLIWRCNCGCRTFWAHATGVLECAQCQKLQNGDGGEWRVDLPQAPSEPKKTEPGDTSFTSLDSPEVALRRTLGKIDPKKAVSVIVIDCDGALHVWGDDYSGEARVSWLDRRLAEIRNMLVVA